MNEREQVSFSFLLLSSIISSHLIHFVFCVEKNKNRKQIVHRSQYIIQILINKMKLFLTFLFFFILSLLFSVSMLDLHLLRQKMNETEQASFRGSRSTTTAANVRNAKSLLEEKRQQFKRRASSPQTSFSCHGYCCGHDTY